MSYKKLTIILVSAIVILSSELFAFAQENTMEKNSIQLCALLPEQISGWSAKSAGEIFTRETIFDYMDGAGEIYLAYDFERLFVCEYGKASAPAIVVEIYQMASSADAYGIFTHDSDGEPVALREEALYGGGYLRFWKGTTFVRILAEKETTETKAAVMAIGGMIADAISEKSQKPVLVTCLPEEGLLKSEVKYFHQLVSLNVLYYVADSNIFNLNTQTDVILARYQGTAFQSRLLLIAYPGVDEAQTAYRQFVQGYFPDKPTTLADIQVEQVEKGEFVSARQTGRFLILVFEARNQTTCEQLTKATEEKLKGAFK